MGETGRDMTDPESSEAEIVRGELGSGRFRLVEDNYFLVLVAIVIAFVLAGLFSSFAFARAAGLAVMGVVFFLTMRVSRPRPQGNRVAAMIGPPILVVIVAAIVVGSDSVIGSIASIFSVVFVVACTVVIAKRLAQHRRISMQTVMGTLCIYLFVSLLFALVFGVIALLGDGAFFAQTEEPTGIDFIYFSLITITTTGFGDLSPVTGLGRMMASVEAILGNLYLVTVVALFVSNLGRTRKDRNA